MKLIERACPFCSSVDPEVILDLRSCDFAPLNPTYDLGQLEMLGFDRNQKFPIVKCRKCGFVYAWHVLDDESLQFVYSTVVSPAKALEYRAKTTSRWGRLPLIHLLFSLAGKHSATLSFLDFGCGWGETLHIAQACGVSCCGVEIEPQRVDLLRSRGFVIENDIASLKHLAPFDVIFCSTVLEHVPDPRQTLEELAAVTRPGGYGFLGVPAYTERRMAAMARDFRAGKGLPNKNINPWEHLNYFSPTSFRSMVEQSGFKVMGAMGNLPPPVLSPALWGSLRFAAGVMKDLVVGLAWHRSHRNRLIVRRT